MNERKKELDSIEIKREELRDIDTIQIDKLDPLDKKLTQFISDTDGNPFTHFNNGYVVKVHFGKEGYTATDAFKHYLSQIAQLKY